MRVNLLAEKKRRYSLNWTGILFATLVIFLLVLLGLNYYLSISKLAAVERELRSQDRQLAMVLPKKEEYLELQKKINNLEKNKEKNELDRYRWAEVVKEQGYIIPEKVTLNFLQINNNIINLSGIAASNQEVLQFIRNMKTSPFFTEVKLRQLKQQQEISFNIEAVISRRGD